eukprot:gnl/Spiro4/3968_TR1976_c0_g1_i1.p1 gnl/Spiro4/3968_TR1976_c0_g1~~gnl/Spiro4/3968_TR1976_c0_g1_i1.p1  ORF type:complete len:368 (-),score=128.67 gnl/Spiro4/3968_TR1976_c0_g1_i1:80-1183(-)
MDRLSSLLCLLCSVCVCVLVGVSSVKAPQTAGHVRNWTLMFYYCGNNSLANYTFVDVRKLTDGVLPADADLSQVAVHMLISTSIYGSYHLEFAADPHAGFTMTSSHSSFNMSKEDTLVEFIKRSAAASPAANYVLWYSGHGSAWYMIAQDDSIIPVATWQKAVESAGVHFSALVFDTCLMSNLEALHQLRNVTDWVLACETYGPWEGFLGSHLLNAFQQSTSTPKLLEELVANFLVRNAGLPDPADAAVVNVRAVGALSAFVVGLNLTEADFHTDDDTLDPDTNNHDLMWTVLSLPEERLSLDMRSRFVSLFDGAVQHYRQLQGNSSVIALYNKLHHSISVVRSPMRDAANAWAYDLLELHPVAQNK